MSDILLPRFELEPIEQTALESWASRTEDSLSINHFTQLDTHYKLIKSIRHRPKAGANLLSILASSTSEQVRAHAAITTVYLVPDQPIAASDLWVNFYQENSGIVRQAANLGTYLAMQWGYLDEDAVNLIRHSSKGLRTECDDNQYFDLQNDRYRRRSSVFSEGRFLDQLLGEEPTT